MPTDDAAEYNSGSLGAGIQEEGEFPSIGDTSVQNGSDHILASSVPIPTNPQAFGREKNLIAATPNGTRDNGPPTSFSYDNTTNLRTVSSGADSFTSKPVAYDSTLQLPPDNIGNVLTNLIPLIPLEVPKDTKRKKPKSSLVKNNSSFLSKTIVHDSLNKKLAEHPPKEIFIWANLGRSLLWFDMGSMGAGQEMTKEPLSKILFTKNHPLCHDVNQFTRSVSGMELVLGMSSGDAVWLDASSNRYNRINKNGDIARSAVTDIKWIPGSTNYFVALHANGTLIIYDKDREDGGFASAGGLNHQDLRSTDTFRIVKSLYGTTASGTANGSAPLSNKHNPVAMYKLSHKSLTSVVFSPDRKTLVVTSSDGFLRFLNLETEVITDIFPSYYDGILCAAFSPDGNYLATGGQDDLVAIWSVKRKCIIARGYGHQSWVRKVAFDNWNCDEFSYRVGSVGEDGNLILWDFSPKNLNRPKTQRSNHNPESAQSPITNGTSDHFQKGHFRDPSTAKSITSGVSGTTVLPSGLLQQQQQQQLLQHQQVQTSADACTTVLHPFVGRDGVPTIPPVVIKSVKLEGSEAESLSDIVFLSDKIVVAGKDGKIWTWARP